METSWSAALCAALDDNRDYMTPRSSSLRPHGVGGIRFWERDNLPSSKNLARVAEAVGLSKPIKFMLKFLVFFLEIAVVTFMFGAI